MERETCGHQGMLGFDFTTMAFGKLFGVGRNVVKRFIFHLLRFGEAMPGNGVPERLGLNKMCWPS